MLRVGLFIVKLYANLFYIKCQRRQNVYVTILYWGEKCEYISVSVTDRKKILLDKKKLLFAI